MLRLVTRVVALVACLCLAPALAVCTGDRPDPSDAGGAPGTPPPLPPDPWKAAAIAHGGVGSPPDRSDGCRRAVDAALAVLEAGGEPVDAAAAGVAVLDDPRFNAGTGSRVRIDGRTGQSNPSPPCPAGRAHG